MEKDHLDSEEDIPCVSLTALSLTARNCVSLTALSLTARDCVSLTALSLTARDSLRRRKEKKEKKHKLWVPLDTAENQHY